MILKKHMWFFIIIFVLVGIVTFLTYQYDLLVSTLQSALVASLIVISALAVIFAWIFKEGYFAGKSNTMRAKKHAYEIYEKEYGYELKPEHNAIQRRRFDVGEDEKNDFIAILAERKLDNKKKVLIYNVNDNDIWDVLDRDSFVRGKEGNLFDGFTPWYRKIGTGKKPSGAPLVSIGERHPFEPIVEEEKKK